ncbi:2,5-diamino-6-ribosylamino-4(3H)-pyrimidinone 5'-phosphate reductase [Aspergillus awamori]|uniref:2,5-diamino-6-ribosylamino-4(3H)-pyrimidinone 5'-phosphate reductase n=1 Tax=Aspergillus awamori TaxID=105351 RepID=A0A401L600_ASPAW|nr:2,5-diamino-6-ribosylamino-4(3H)-pyrimidinone 5'-phosphate reductase [Aspergillus awamori]GKZ59242.1 2,5-diamino-6-(ribosylamino)-4(3H)-pyrimidinone 5'-phosphate reductase [Aspergillus niger]
MDSLNFPAQDRAFLEPHLPPKDGNPLSSSSSLPFTTLTFATSLDSQLALSPGTRTALSGPQSKAMTHYLRSRHDAILIGVGTAVADNPGLNCRLAGVGGYGSEGLAGQPRPIIIDPSARWEFTAQSKIFELARNGRGRAPFIITAAETVPSAPQREVLESHGGKFIALPVGVGSDGAHRIDWTALLECLVCEGLRSVMIEGGGSIINSLLEPGCQTLVDSVIVTIAPTWLGQGGVVVSPRRRVEGGVVVPASRLTGVKWYPFGEDVVLCGRIKGSD